MIYIMFHHHHMYVPKDSTDRIMLYVIIALLPASLLVFTILDLEHFFYHSAYHRIVCGIRMGV